MNHLGQSLCLTWCSHLQGGGGNAPPSSVLIVSSQEQRGLVHPQTCTQGQGVHQHVAAGGTFSVCGGVCYLLARPAVPGQSERLRSEAAGLLGVRT